jgi:Xaa-Pro aminopeptidase
VLLKDSDQPVPFRQRRYFYYLSGCNESDCYVLYDISKDFLTLYIPKVDLRHAVWGGAGSTKAEAYAKYDVDAVEYTSALFSFGSVDGRVERKSLGTLYLTNTHQSPTENVFHVSLPP